MERLTQRRLEAFGGALALAFGLFYLLYGVPGFTSSGAGDVTASEALVVGVDFPFAVENQAGLHITWSSSKNITVYLVGCGAHPECGAGTHPEGSPENGTGGAFVIVGQNGQFYAVGATGNASVDYRAVVLFPYFYLALPSLTLGGLLLFITFSNYRNASPGSRGSARFRVAPRTDRPVDAAPVSDTDSSQDDEP